MNEEFNPKFLTTTVTVEDRTTEQVGLNPALKSEKITVTVELVGSGNTSGISSQYITEEILSRLKEIQVNA